MAALGIDLGGTKIEAILLNDKDDILWRCRKQTPKGDYEATVSTILAIVNEVRTRFATPITIGIGTPGSSLPASGLMRNCNSTCLNGRPFLADLQARIPENLLIENDANCFILSEQHDGSAVSCETAFGVIIGTGVGGGLIVNGQLVTGVNRIGGEWGHNYFPTDALNNESIASLFAELTCEAQLHCYCGRHSCNETHLSGSAISSAYHIKSGEMISAELIYQRYCAGDFLAEKVMKVYAEKLAFALSQVINIFDPEVIVLGGGLSNMSFLYDTVPNLWCKYVFSDSINTRLLRPKHGGASGVRGAARLASSL